jgi:hypothetical protein
MVCHTAVARGVPAVMRKGPVVAKANKTGNGKKGGKGKGKKKGKK